MSRLVVFIEGPVVFKAGKEVGVHPDYVRMKDEMANLLSCNEASARYYHAEPSNGSSDGINRFLDGLDAMSGMEVLRVHARRLRLDCPHCGHHFVYDDLTMHATIINDILVGAYEERFDVGVVVSGRADFVSVIELIDSLEGMEMCAAFWGKSRMLNRELRETPHFIDLADLDIGYNRGARKPVTTW